MEWGLAAAFAAWGAACFWFGYDHGQWVLRQREIERLVDEVAQRLNARRDA